MDQNKEWWIKERMYRTVEKLKAHDFEALAVQKKEDVLEEILKYIAPHARWELAVPSPFVNWE